MAPEPDDRDHDAEDGHGAEDEGWEEEDDIALVTLRRSAENR